MDCVPIGFHTNRHELPYLSYYTMERIISNDDYYLLMHTYISRRKSNISFFVFEVTLRENITVNYYKKEISRYNKLLNLSTLVVIGCFINQ